MNFHHRKKIDQTKLSPEKNVKLSLHPFWMSRLQFTFLFSAFEVPAEVPGGIFTDLRHGSILNESIYYRFNDVKYRWVSKESWTYFVTFISMYFGFIIFFYDLWIHLFMEWSTNHFFYSILFSVDGKNILNGKNVELIFHGLDGIAKISLNHQLLGEVSNTFVRYRFDVTGKLVSLISFLCFFYATIFGGAQYVSSCTLHYVLD